MMAKEFHDVISIGQKIRQMSEWLETTAPVCASEQKHLEEGSQERVYWLYGYLAALKDVLQFITGSTKVADCALRRVEKRPTATPEANHF